MENRERRPVGVVVGLAAEARLARLWGVPVAVGGGDAAGAARAAERLVDAVSGLISFGLAGGLAPGLRAGDLLVPARIVMADDVWPTDDRLCAALGGATGHTLLGGGRVLATGEEKRGARDRMTVDAVDLESAAVARVAARRGMPFAVLRAVCDEAGRALPAAALVALDGAGRIGGLRVLGAVLRRPWEVPALIALGRDAARARAALLGRVRATELLDWVA